MDRWVTLALVSLATFRATWFITVDDFPPIARFRSWVTARFGEGSAVAYLVTCLWCVSVWLGGFITILTDLFVSVPLPVLVWATSSAVTGILGIFVKGMLQKNDLNFEREKLIMLEQAKLAEQRRF
jgi:hypothetical protein